ncbi:IclR family transcriptional regulator [Stakelama pacifica]|uniref:IclR family transcriptional regulator n=1 Tax=Stakelama pacifica TaxID=517720 RepID=A0A4V3BSF2_9SPHN|nr:IclR family transcriptional regulator [Stakelama pacifica]TDN78608.1 IclR family transcriptional regulator [Stakelama pacifica]GGO99396.1 IclR family transcriptional regulator [Stakelama pacifica]
MSIQIDESEKTEGSATAVGAGSQTLMRGLDLIEAASKEVLTLSELAQRVELTKSTTHRLLSALVDRGYLAFTPRSGYRLGPKLLLLGTQAQAQADLVQVARPYLEELAAATEDTVHIGILDGDMALYLDKVPGRRRITISSRIGDRQPLTSTGLGKALMLDHAQEYWLERFAADQASGAPKADPDVWNERMAGYVAAGRSYDLEENEDQIRCVAAPVRDAGGTIIGAISVSSAAQYMSDARMETLSDNVLATAAAISRELGHEPPE